MENKIIKTYSQYYQEAIAEGCGLSGARNHARYMSRCAADQFNLKQRPILIQADSKCAKCGSIEKLELDHIIPVCKDGPNTVENLQILCMRCNRRKKV